MTDATNHLTPQNLEAEEAILGAMLMSPWGIEQAQNANLKADDFYRTSHRVIFDAIMEIAKKTQPDELTVINRLKQAKRIDEVGGPIAVMSLAERVPAVANAKAYAVEVATQAVLRGLVEDGNEIARLGYEHPDEPENLVTEAGRIIDARAAKSTRNESGMTTLADQWQLLYSEMTDRSLSGASMSGLASGYAAIDKRLGGYQAGKLYVVAGRPGMGKSIFGSSVAENISFGSAVDTLTFNLEMSPIEQSSRGLARAGRLNLHRISNAVPTADDFQLAADTINRMSDAARFVHIDESPGLTVDQIRQRSHRLNRELKKIGRSVRFILIDYMQRITWPKHAKDEYAAVSFISTKLKELALELGVPVMALAQLSRAVEQRPDKKPVLSDLRGSGQIEQDADVIQFLYRPEYYLKDDTPDEWRGVVNVETAKWRNGEIGSDQLGFIGASARMTNPVVAA